MSNKPTPFAVAMILLLSNQAYANGGLAGQNGISKKPDGSTINLIGAENKGNPGTQADAAADGEAGDSIAGLPPIVLNGLLITGEAGEDGGGRGSVGGNGGASIIGGISLGGAGGDARGYFNIPPTGGTVFLPALTNGGNGGNISGNTIQVNNTTLTGAAGGNGAGSGVAGNGGGSLFGGISIGGVGGVSLNLLKIDSPSTIATLANGGNGGLVSGHTVLITNSILEGAAGGSGVAGNGGGSVFGGISTGGAGGDARSDALFSGPPPPVNSSSSSNGGNGGDVIGNSITLDKAWLDGRSGVGGAGDGPPDPGGSGAAGNGGASVFGGVSIGGAGGSSAADLNLHSSNTSTAFYTSSANGGNGGNVSGNTMQISNSMLTGAAGGSSSSSMLGGSGAAGNGGASVFGGISIGGAGGASNTPYYSNHPSSSSSSANGGHGGNVTGNSIALTTVQLDGSSAPKGSSSAATAQGGTGAVGYDGGSVFGGISTGGAGGYSNGSASSSANGGNGGDVVNNKITISGKSKLTSIYGGISQGGDHGQFQGALTPLQDGEYGSGGLVKNNIITLIGDEITILGSIYGGLSLNGDGTENLDPTYSNFYKGNTINIRSGHLSLNGEMRNFQNYNWLLPKNEFDGDVIVTVESQGTAVNIDNTIHKVDVEATGNTLHAGDRVILIDRVTGDFDRAKSATYLEQGFFIVYDAEMDVQGINGNDALVLNVLGVDDSIPDGVINPESEEFLKGRIAQLAMVNQGADMISDGISYARASLRKENANIFAIVDGGSNKYKNGGASTLKLNDLKFALGAAKAFKFENKSVGMLAAFVEHGNGNYHSYNHFDYFGDIRASGKVRYNGVGLMFHMDVADTDTSKVESKPNIFDDKYGLYVDAALRAGHIKADFHSADMVNGAGVEASYNTKSRYLSAMAGLGYVWTLDEKQALDFYGRFTYSRLNGKGVQVVDEQMNAGAAHSKRLRLGARYGYAYSDKVTPYAGIAYERDFTGDVTGSAYGFTIKETSLKGNTGIVEAGVMVKPNGADDPFSLLMGVQGYFAQRKGASASIRARYVF